jgi:hypothetical protein
MCGHYRTYPTSNGAACGEQTCWIHSFRGFDSSNLQTDGSWRINLLWICGIHAVGRTIVDFASFSEGEEMSFRSFRFHFNMVGSILLTDPSSLAPVESKSSTVVTESTTTSFVGSCSEIDSTSALLSTSASTPTPAKIYCSECDVHHITSPNDSMIVPKYWHFLLRILHYLSLGLSGVHWILRLN